MILAIFSDGSCAKDPQRAYFVFYQSKGKPGGPYVCSTIAGAIETAREHLSVGDAVWLEMQRKPIEDGGEQVKIWDSRKPPKRQWGQS
jgi:hypothetical protein